MVLLFPCVLLIRSEMDVPNTGLSIDLDPSDVDPIVEAIWRIDPQSSKKKNKRYETAGKKTQKRRRDQVIKFLELWKRDGVPNIAFDFLIREHELIVRKHKLRRLGDACTG